MAEKRLGGGKTGYVIAPSILSADFSKLGECVKQIKEAEYIHVDVMDGAFVPNISFGAGVMGIIRSCSKQIFDVHMMVEEPGRYLADFAKAGADILCVHAEACRHLDRTLEQIHELGCRAAVALNPATSLESIRWVLNKVDMVLIMSVNPGFGGQQFIPGMLEKISQLYDMLETMGLQGRLDIEVDGGVKLNNVSSVIEAGANIIVAGSAVYQGTPQENVKRFHQVFEEYCN